jgi:GNAT superfamily N-acetyltransferase
MRYRTGGGFLALVVNRRAVVSTGEVRPFRRADRDQLTALVNAHVQAVIPGMSVSVNAVLSQLERDPGEFIVDPWVSERVTLVVEQRGRVSAATHLVRYGTGTDVGPALRGTGEIRWLIYWPDAPFWPDSSAAGAAVAHAAVAVLRRWQVAKITADGTLPAPGVYGLPEQWPHVREVLERVGFVRGDRTEVVLLADVASLPRSSGHTVGLDLVRTLGVSGTRFTARRDGVEVGFIEINTGISGAGRVSSHEGWADVGNLHVDEAHRRRGVGTWLIARAADWLRLARVDRLLDYAAPQEVARLAFLERLGFSRLTETAREWQLDI